LANLSGWDEGQLPMLRQLGQHISAAHQHARECRERARATYDEAQKAELAELEKSWLELAKNFENLKSMEDPLLETTKALGLRLWV
jgi:hypothetical protein